MINCNCVVQAGQIPPDTEMLLRERLSDFTMQAFQAPAQIDWAVIPEESGFTAGLPSTTSVVVITAKQSLAQERRKVLLEELCDLWIAETGCSINEVVGVIADPQGN